MTENNNKIKYSSHINYIHYIIIHNFTLVIGSPAVGMEAMMYV